MYLVAPYDGSKMGVYKSEACWYIAIINWTAFEYYYL